MRVKLFLALMAGLAILVAGIDSFAVKGASVRLTASQSVRARSTASSSMAARDYRDDPYFRGRALDQYSVNAVSSLFRNHSATSSLPCPQALTKICL
jgi:hypothetical protein